MLNKISSIILAAGKSERIGEAKAFLKFNGTPFLIHIIEKLLNNCKKIVVVFGYNAQNLIEMFEQTDIYKKHSEKISIVINSDFEKGMMSSIKCGIKEVRNSKFVLIHQVDQPNLPKNFYSEFIEQVDDNIDWLQPSFNKKPGHPVIINQKVSSLILKEDSDISFRVFRKKYPFNVKLWECSHPQIHQDIDTIEDYNELIKR